MYKQTESKAEAASCDFYDKYNLIVRRVLDLNVSALCIITTTQFHVIDVLIYRLWTIWILTDVYLVEKKYWQNPNANDLKIIQGFVVC